MNKKLPEDEIINWDDFLTSDDPEKQEWYALLRQGMIQLHNETDVQRTMNPQKMKVISWTLSELPKIMETIGQTDYEIKTSGEMLLKIGYGIKMRSKNNLRFEGEGLSRLARIIVMTDSFDFCIGLCQETSMSFSYDDAYLREFNMDAKDKPVKKVSIEAYSIPVNANSIQLMAEKIKAIMIQEDDEYHKIAISQNSSGNRVITLSSWGEIPFRKQESREELGRIMLTCKSVNLYVKDEYFYIDFEF